MVAERLAALGMRILRRNYRTRHGEADIVADDEGELVFVEVKTRRSSSYGMPEESITPAKARRMVMAAQSFLEEVGHSPDWRIDVAIVELGGRGQVRRVHLHKNAVSEDAI